MKHLLHLRSANRTAFRQGQSALLSFLALAAGVGVWTPTSALAQSPSALPPLTVPSQTASAPVLISELRASGPRGPQDAFIELFNNTSRPISLAGWSLRGRDVKGAPVTFNIAAGTQIGARGHLLLAGSDYSLKNLATADRPLAANVNLSRGVRLCDARGKLIDAVGPATSEAAFREGIGLPAFAFVPILGGRSGAPASQASLRTPISQFSLVRQAIDGQPQDTGDNARDFALVSVSGALGAQKTRIGTPGPENASSSPLRPMLRSAGGTQAPLKVSPTQNSLMEGASTETSTLETTSTEISATAGAQARQIALQTDPASNSMRRARRELGPLKTFGTMTLRYRLVNDSPNPIKSLSFRVNSITSDPNGETALAGSADIRLIRGVASPTGASAPAETSATEKTALGAGIETGTETQSAPARRTQSVWRARLSPVPSQPRGGALNALLNVELPAGGIAPGARGEIWFAFGVERAGNYRVVLGNQTMNIVFEGHTEEDLQSTENLEMMETGAPSGQRSTSGAGGARPTDAGNLLGAGGTTTPATEPEAEAEAGEGIILEGHTEDGVPAPPVDPSTKDS